MEAKQIICGLCATSDYSSISSYTSTNQYSVFKRNNLVVYKSKSKPIRSDAVVLLSGGCILEFTAYIRKFIDSMKFECDVYVCENKETYNMLCVNDIANFIDSLDNSHVTVIGFSMGGVLGSHALTQTRLTKSTLITIDTPFDITRSAPYIYDDFKLYRPDILYLYHVAVKNCTTATCFDYLTTLTFDGYADFICKHYKLSREHFLSVNKMNPDIRNCKIISFNTMHDIVIIPSNNQIYIDEWRQKLHETSTYTQCYFDMFQPGHCTVWNQPHNSLIVCDQIRIHIFLGAGSSATDI